MDHLCTIITKDFFGYAEALAKSLEELGSRSRLHVLVVDGEVNPPPESRIICYTPRSLALPLARELEDAYLRRGKVDEYRWSMKSVFLQFLLFEKEDIDKAIFVDPDVAFFADPTFLFNELDQHALLLTPHWRCHEPWRDRTNFDLLFTGGLFNAGFIGASRRGKEALEWLSRVCLDECVVDRSRGRYVDQTYLNLLPIYFENVKILRHKGCNVAIWNISEFRPTESDGSPVCQSGDPVVFLHITRSLIEGVRSGAFPAIAPLVKAWIEWIGGSPADAHVRRKVRARSLPERWVRKLAGGARSVFSR